MKCAKCGGENVTIQMIANTKKKGKGALYWLFIGWWLEPMLWLFLTIPMIIIAICGGGKRTKTVVEKHFVCQSCGHSWKG